MPGGVIIDFTTPSEPQHSVKAPKEAITDTIDVNTFVTLAHPREHYQSVQGECVGQFQNTAPVSPNLDQDPPSWWCVLSHALKKYVDDVFAK